VKDEDDERLTIQARRLCDDARNIVSVRDIYAEQLTGVSRHELAALHGLHQRGNLDCGKI
jgi:hypothetical protein